MAHNKISGFESIEDILEYALTEEQDAAEFYKTAAERTADPELKRFLIELSKMEREHYLALKKKLEECRANSFCTQGILASFSGSDST